jgi:hypothetical protein
VSENKKTVIGYILKGYPRISESFTVHEGYGLAVQNNICPLVIEALIKGGFEFFAGFIGQ